MKKVFFTLIGLVIGIALGSGIMYIVNNDSKNDKKEENNNSGIVNENENKENKIISSNTLNLLKKFDFALKNSSVLGFNDMDKYLFSKDKITKSDLSTEFKIYAAIKNSEGYEEQYDIYNKYNYSSTIKTQLSLLFGNEPEVQLKSFEHDEPRCGDSDFRYDPTTEKVFYEISGCGGTGGSSGISYDILNVVENNNEVSIDMIVYFSKAVYIDENTTKMTYYTSANMSEEIVSFNNDDDSINNYKDKLSKYRITFKNNNFESFEKIK